VIFRADGFSASPCPQTVSAVLFFSETSLQPPFSLVGHCCLLKKSNTRPIADILIPQENLALAGEKPCPSNRSGQIQSFKIFKNYLDYQE
jgi:hypothetical protein